VNEKLLKKKIHLLNESEFPKIENEYLGVRWSSLQTISKLYDEDKNKEMNGIDKNENHTNLYKVKIIIPL
jgi:hypothetical protein